MLAELNDEQKQAVQADDGPLLIVAGPGTGKTKTLTARIAHLIASSRAKPDEILALTFTNKAAAEMLGRVRSLLGNAEQLPRIATFHALCHELLSRESEQPINFITEHERQLLIGQLRRSATLKTLTTRELALEISRRKNLPSDEGAGDSLSTLLALYNQTLRQRNLRDFDDLLQDTYQLLQRQPLGERYQYILVDEFQDTNVLQYELLGLLRCNENLCVIGDPAQSIYGFRGASQDVFDRFRTDFPQSHTTTLTINYRSTPPVVQLANALFPEAPQLTPHRTQSGQVRAVEVLNEYCEADWIIAQIERSVGGTDFLRSHNLGHDEQPPTYTFRDFAILQRTHHVGKIVRRKLAESGIPYQVVGEGSPYHQPDIWAIIQTMCYLADPTDIRRTALDTISPLKQFSDAQRTNLIETLRLRDGETLCELAERIAETFGLSTDSLPQLTSTLVRFERAGLSALTEYIDNLSDTDFYDPRARAVTLMTIHAAKGLEFPHVFLIGAEEGILPHQRSGISANLAEERRLFYVAITRAQEKLDILYTKTRVGNSATPSRFLTELPDAVLSREQDAAMATRQRQLQKRRAKRNQTSLF